MRCAFLVFGFSSVLFGQLDSNSIVITSSRQINLHDDEVVFAVTVESGVDATLDQVVAALQSPGISAANLADVETTDGGLAWVFGVPAPLPKMQATLASLEALRQFVAAKKGGFTVTYAVAGSRLSDQSQSRSCSTDNLIADAQTQAQKLANSVGLVLGPILSISSPTLDELSFAGFGTFSLSLAPTYLISVPTILARAPFVDLSSPVAPTCAITVKFQLLRYQ